MRISVIPALVLVILLSGARPGYAQEPPAITVVASIQPVHSLVAGVMAGVGTPYLLVPGGASPHSFALRPSAAMRIEKARAIFWIGPSLEAFLERPLDALARKAEVVALAEIEGVTRLPVREGGPWEAHDHHGAASEIHGEAPHAPEADHHRDLQAHRDATHAAEHDDAHHHGDWNPHVWLDPQNAVVFVDGIAQTLARADPANGKTYARNAKRLTDRLRALDAALRRTLAPVRDKPYIVFHDAYQYFETRYGLHPVGSITVSPALSPGARRLVAIRNRIRSEKALCVFAEPQFEPKLVRTAVQGTGARTATLDPLGARLEAGPDAYFQLMRNLARDLTGCLLGPS